VGEGGLWLVYFVCVYGNRKMKSVETVLRMGGLKHEGDDGINGM
jgi:hypothetical protein